MTVEEIILKKFLESKHQSPNDWLIELINENLLQQKNRSVKGHLLTMAVCLGLRTVINKETYINFSEFNFLNENNEIEYEISEETKKKYLPIFKEWLSSLNLVLLEYYDNELFSIEELLEILSRLEKIGEFKNIE